MLHKTYQSCESLDYSNYNLQQKNKQHHSPQPLTSQIAHSPNFQTPDYNFSPSPSYQQSTSKINMPKRKFAKPVKTTSKQKFDQVFDYNLSLTTYQDQSYSKNALMHPTSIKSPDLDSSNLILQTFRNERNEKQQQQLFRLQQHQQPPPSKPQQSIYGTNSRKYFTAERSHSMLDPSHLQLRKHQNFVQQQKSIANELKQKQKLKEQSNKEFLLPMYEVKEKAKSRDFLSDELLSEEEEEDTPSSGLSG